MFKLSGEYGKKYGRKNCYRHVRQFAMATVISLAACIGLAVCFPVNRVYNDKGYQITTDNATVEANEKNIEKNTDAKDNRTIFANDYTGYMDEFENYYFKNSFENMDVDSDGKPDRVYREYLGNDLCNFELRFGDGSILKIDRQSKGVCPSFYALPNEAGKLLVLYYGSYPGACGEVVIFEMGFYEKQGNEYVLSKVPFNKKEEITEDNRETFPQYMNVAVSLVDEDNYVVGYSCEQLNDFYKEIQMDKDSYECISLKSGFESFGERIEFPDIMFYRFCVSKEDPYVVECIAHILYHCADELMVGIKYVDDEWKIVYYDMIKRWDN